jgi:hypothetical protein
MPKETASVFIKGSMETHTSVPMEDQFFGLLCRFDECVEPTVFV